MKTVVSSEERKINGGKNERQKAVHRSGCASCLLSVIVRVANIHETKGGISTARRAYKQYPTILKFCTASRYRGTFVADMYEQFDLDLDISEKIKPHQWGKLP